MPFPKSQWIWLNGQMVPWEAANVHVTAHALHYGSSIFEGLRAYETAGGTAILGLEAHVRRLFESSRLTRIPIAYTQEQVQQAIVEVVRANGLRSCYIRPLVYRDSDSFSLDGRAGPTSMTIIAFEWGRYLGADAIESGVDVMVSSWRRVPANVSPTFSKTGGNYINSQFVAMEAHEYGFVEGIALDMNGYVSEGSGENIFAIYRGAIYTPALGSSILMGITRDCAITLAKEAGYEVREQMIPRDLLYVADELFFTGTAAEISPVRSVDRIPVGSGSRGPVTKRLQDEFFAIVSGQVPDRFGWLTPINP